MLHLSLFQQGLREKPEVALLVYLPSLMLLMLERHKARFTWWHMAGGFWWSSAQVSHRKHSGQLSWSVEGKKHHKPYCCVITYIQHVCMLLTSSSYGKPPVSSLEKTCCPLISTSKLPKNIKKTTRKKLRKELLRSLPSVIITDIIFRMPIQCNQSVFRTGLKHYVRQQNV